MTSTKTAKNLVSITFEYSPPFDGNSEPLTIGPLFWVEQEGNVLKVDLDDSGDPVEIATLVVLDVECDDESCAATHPGKPHEVNVWRVDHEGKTGVFGRFVVFPGAPVQ